tara:strand:- start:478 stop:1065 length:588 start_codon:yes stop_codon:yes gene_type:complete
VRSEVNQIALLGTSADPPTYGHQALLEGLSRLFPKVITWASDNPIKNHGASLAQRHVFLKTLVNDLAIPQIEIKQELSSPWTIKTLEKARFYWPQEDLILVVGSDLIKQIPGWFQARNLLRKVRIGIAPREGWPIKKKELSGLEKMGGQIDLLPLKLPATSSSKIRKAPNISQIPKSILPLILKEKLYGLSINNL